LKRGTKHASIPPSPGGVSRNSGPEDGSFDLLSPASRARSNSEAGVQTETESQTEKPSRSPNTSSLPVESTSKIEELHQQLQLKNFTIVQLQADMVREQQLREKQSVEKQKRAAESQQMCREELREMTQRAESLSEQVRKSKKRGSELQAARDAAREECASARRSLEECEARLNNEASARSELQVEQDALEAELNELRSLSPRAFQATDSAEVAKEEEDGEELEKAAETSDRRALEERLAQLAQEAEQAHEQRDMAVAELEEATADAASESAVAWAETQELWKGNHGSLVQCLTSLRQLHSDLSKEFRGGRLQRMSQARGSSQLKPEEALERLGQQLGTAQQLIDGPLATTGSRGTRRLSAARAASPEAERPLPEDRRQGAVHPKDSEEVLQMKLDVNEVRVAAERAREKLINGHCDELDDLVRNHDKERRQLHKEINELRSECAAVQVTDMSRPMNDIRAHFESQVTVVKQQLVAQLADIQERQRVQRGQDEQEIGELRRSLDRCQSELASSQYEFATLAMLFDKEQRENFRLRQHREQTEASLHAFNEVAVTPVPSEMANVATVDNSHDFTPETTLATDTLPVAALAAEAARRANARDSGADEHQAVHTPAMQVPSSTVKSVALKMAVKDDGRDPPTTLLNAPPPQMQAARHGVSTVSMLRGALPPPQNRSPAQPALSPSVTQTTTPTSAVCAVMAAAAKLRTVGTHATKTTTTVIQRSGATNATV